jgi:hypothetical protein
MMGVTCCMTERCTAIIPKFQPAVNEGYDKCYTTKVTRKVVLPHDCYIPAGFFTVFGFIQSPSAKSSAGSQLCVKTSLFALV